MKFRKHHNNKAYRSTKRGKRIEEVKLIAKKLGIKYNETTIQNNDTYRDTTRI